MVAGLKNNNVHAKNLSSGFVPSYRTRLLLGRPLYMQKVKFYRMGVFFCLHLGFSKTIIIREILSHILNSFQVYYIRQYTLFYFVNELNT